MKIRIERDELWPCYRIVAETYDRYSFSRQTGIDVPKELVDEYEASLEAYEKVQDKLHELFEREQQKRKK